MVQAQTPILAIVMDYPTSIPTDAMWMQLERNATAQVDQDNTAQSYGLFVPATDVVGPYVIDPAPLVAATNADAGRLAIAQSAQAAALANGVDLSRYQWDGTLGGSCHCVYLFPSPSEFGASWNVGGMADGLGVFISGASLHTALPSRAVLTHELGHHFGIFWEQEGLDCSDQSPIGGASGVTCTPVRYQDSLDVMGKGQGQFNAIEKCRQGWLPCPSAVGPGDYFLSPLESATGTRSLVINVAKRGQYLITLEYRQPVASDALTWPADPANVYSGVIAHTGSTPTRLLRLHHDNPAYNSATFNSPALPVGETVCFSDARLSLTTLSADANGALVRIGRCH